jgi:hypothetical protein
LRGTGCAIRRSCRSVGRRSVQTRGNAMSMSLAISLLPHPSTVILRYVCVALCACLLLIDFASPISGRRHRNLLRYVSNLHRIASYSMDRYRIVSCCIGIGIGIAAGWVTKVCSFWLANGIWIGFDAMCRCVVVCLKVCMCLRACDEGTVVTVSLRYDGSATKKLRLTISKLERKLR